MRNTCIVVGLLCCGKVEVFSQLFSPMELGFEWAESDDVSLYQTSWTGDFVSSEWETSVSVAYGYYSMDYLPVPFDFNGRETRLRERNLALAFNTQKQVGKTFSFTGGTGFYDGFTNYRSVWLDEYYRQQFADLGDAPGAENYVRADPKGINATAGARWEYRPGTGFAEFNVSWLRDDVSPGYEIDFDGLRRSPLTLNTGAVGLSTENILTKRLRSYLGARVSKTTERSARYGLDGELYLSLGSNWSGRVSSGASTENPRFEAIYAGLALEHRIEDKWSWYVDLQYYEDTGEIENALLFTSAAPGLVSERAGIGLRWTEESWSGKIYLAHLHADYEPTRANIDFFQNLYRDRDWTVFQFALGRSL